jgi:DNA-binding MarR family transcriptional regulator
MSQQKVLDYLSEHGEMAKKEMKIPGVTPKALFGILNRLCANGSVSKREVGEENRRYFVFNIGPPLVEPEYSYILRNLPRKEFHG